MILYEIRSRSIVFQFLESLSNAPVFLLNKYEHLFNNEALELLPQTCLRAIPLSNFEDQLLKNS